MISLIKSSEEANLVVGLLNTMVSSRHLILVVERFDTEGRHFLHVVHMKKTVAKTERTTYSLAKAMMLRGAGITNSLLA